MTQLDPIGLAILALAFWLALAVPVRLAGGKLLAHAAGIYDWNVRLGVHRLHRATGRLRRRGWSGRHGLPDPLVALIEDGATTVAELEEIAERPAVEDVGLAAELTEAEQAEAAAMTKTVGEVRETFTFTEASRSARRAALQGDTILIPVVTIQEVDAAARTRAEFAEGDGVGAVHDLEFATALGVFLNDNMLLLAELEVARMYRGWYPSTTGEQPVVIPRQRMAVA